MCIESFPPTHRLEIEATRGKTVVACVVQLPLITKATSVPSGSPRLTPSSSDMPLVVVSCMLQSGHENREMLDQNASVQQPGAEDIYAMTMTAAAAKPARAKEPALALAAPVKAAGLTPVLHGRESVFKAAFGSINGNLSFLTWSIARPGRWWWPGQRGPRW